MCPDKTFGHQVADYGDTDRQRKALGDYPSTYAIKGGNGITAYGTATANSTIFDTVYNNDKNWGLFEYNRLSASTSFNLTALNTVWNSLGHIICPYIWYGQPTYQIRDTAFETALSQFIAAKANSSYTGLPKYNAAPESKDIIWAMSETDDVEVSANLNSITFTSGVMKATASSSAPEISLEIDADHSIKSEEFYTCAFRIYLTNSAGNTGKISWHDSSGSYYETEFIAKDGWNVYNINLIESANWRNKNIDAVKFFPGAENGSDIIVDWFQFKASQCWNFDDSGELHGINNVTSPTFSGSNFSGTSANNDPHFYFSTDDDRNYIDTDFYKKIRVRMNSSAAGTAQIYWWTRTGGPFAHIFSVQTGWNNYEIDMSDVADWSGDVNTFRLDPITASDVSFDIAYLNISPILLPPRIINSDLILNSPKPFFLWDKPLEPEHANVTYSVRLADNTEFTNILFFASGVSTNFTNYDCAELMDGTYWWQVRAETASDISDWVEPMPVFIRAWKFETDADTWILNSFDAPIITDGIWKANTTNNDPYVYFKTGLDRGINADLYTKFVCRIKLSPASGANTAQFFCFPEGGGHEAKNFSLPHDTEWHNIELDLTTMTKWNGYIRNVRIDPVGGAGTTVEIDAAYFLPKGAKMLSVVGNNLPSGQISNPYSHSLSATNELGNVSWTLIDGNLPNGLTLSSAGNISGTPNVPGIINFTVEAKDDLQFASNEFSIEIIPEPGIVFCFLFLVAGILFNRVTTFQSTKNVE